MHSVIIGAGPTGSATARLLHAEGERCVLVSRTRSALHPDGVPHVPLDATDTDALARASDGATTVFFCAMPRYDRWPEAFPPLLEGVLGAARQVGARLVIVGNVYGYGEHAAQPLVEDAPLVPTTRKGRVRAAMWECARESGVPVCEVRGSDYLGHGVVSAFSLVALPSLLAGEPVAFPGDHDVPHAWTFTDDVARTLIAASRHEASWGRAWHVPSSHASVRELVARFAAHAGVPVPTLAPLALDRDDPIANEVAEMLYLLERPCVLDATGTTRVLGIHASPLDEAVRATLRG